MSWFTRLRRPPPPAVRAGSSGRRASVNARLHIANLRRLRGLLQAVVGINLAVLVVSLLAWDQALEFLGSARLRLALIAHRVFWIVLDAAGIALLGRLLAAPGRTSRLALAETLLIAANMLMAVSLTLALYPYYHTVSLFYVAIFAVVPLLRLDLTKSLIAIALPGLALLAGVLREDPGLPINLSNALNIVAMTLLSLVSARFLYAERVRDLLQQDIIARQQAELGRQALTDELTGLPNRRSLDAALEREWRRAARTEGALAAVMIDIDLFKQYNDARGHAAGDDCLRLVAGCLTGCLRRAGDMAARYGGEEFTVLLPGVGLDGAVAVAEAMRREVEALDHAHACSPFGRRTVRLGGAAPQPGREDAPGALLARADQALYAAKNAGRNTVRPAWTPPAAPGREADA